MPPIKSAFAAAAVLWLLVGPAAATPVVIDPNFNQTPTSGPKFYGIAAWGAAILPGGGPAQNPSYAGSIGPDAFNQWNNGTPGNMQKTVGFLANGGSYIFQAISGFSVGGTYQISLLANGRILDANNPVKPMAALAITSSFFGTQPILTQVPPQKRSSATPTRAPYPAAIRAQRTPPEPPPMTNRSKS